MKIVIIGDAEFPAIFDQWQVGEEVGRFWHHSEENAVRISSLHVVIAAADSPGKFTVKPAKNLEEARSIARRFLERQLERGAEVTFK